MSSNWGRVNSSKQIARGVREVHCEGHGGILITDFAMENQPFLKKLKDYPLLSRFYSDRGGYEFEEDCEASIILFALGKEVVQKIWAIPEEKIDELWNGIIRSLIMWNPDVYTYLSGNGVSIFESHTLRDQHYVECGHVVHKLYWTYRPDDYELPEGKRIFSTYEVNDIKAVKHFIIDAKEYENIRKFPHLPVDVSNLQEVEAPQRKLKTA